LFLKVISVGLKEIHIRELRVHERMDRRSISNWFLAVHYIENQRPRVCRKGKVPLLAGPLRIDHPGERPPLPAGFAAANSARDSVKQVFMREGDHRRGFDAQGVTPPRIRHFVGMSSWGPDRKERER
jgi:hypothetical protein